MRSSVIALSGRVEWTGRSFTRTRGVRRATDPKIKGEADNTTLDIIVSKEHCEIQIKQCARLCRTVIGQRVIKPINKIKFQFRF